MSQNTCFTTGPISFSSSRNVNYRFQWRQVIRLLVLPCLLFHCASDSTFHCAYTRIAGIETMQTIGNGSSISLNAKLRPPPPPARPTLRLFKRRQTAGFAELGALAATEPEALPPTLGYSP